MMSDEPDPQPIISRPQTTLHTGNGAAVTMVQTERGVELKIAKGYIIVYRSVITDDKRSLKFEVEKVGLD